MSGSAAQTEACRWLASLSSSSGDRLTALRMACRALSQLDFSDEVHSFVLALSGVESETDHFPTGTQREGWSQEALMRLDAERDGYLERVEDEIQKSCARLIDDLRCSTAE